ncbi:MAG: hypothetical protein P3T54_00620 [Dehalogenimonas sp.]|jgi:hypothetical protein|uniref:Uncharacterized protein n=1 Tax=Candidatus Dehalogenimonas loeffleri TaxID=3127115 RepID=A0ABZ2J2W1_9CHLR|nr:hypothetical protein [Dehalogenimonas sp.]
MTDDNIGSEEYINVRLQQYDPPKSIPYTRLLDSVVRGFAEIRKPEDIIRVLGADYLTDITHTPELEGGAGIRLYDGGDERVYQFKETDDRGGTLDVVFNHGRLESFSARLYFSGMWGKLRATAYSSLRFARLIHGYVGRSNVRYDDTTHYFYCYRDGLIISYTHQLELGLPSLSTYIVSRQDCGHCAVGEERRQLAVCSCC